jgi:hypothetical protein
MILSETSGCSGQGIDILGGKCKFEGIEFLCGGLLVHVRYGAPGDRPGCSTPGGGKETN